MTTTIRTSESTGDRPVVFMSCEMSEREWKLTFTTGLGDPRHRRTVGAWGWAAVLAAIAGAKRRFGLPETTSVQSCYEAGREGFAPHRFLVAHGITNHVIDPASLRVDRRKRRVKTDRVDGNAQVIALLHFVAGDREALREVRVPTPEHEAAREISRELAALTAECTRYTNQMRGLLQTQGIRVRLDRDFLQQLATATDWAGTAVSAPLQARLGRLWARRETVRTQRRDLERATRVAIRQDALLDAATMRQLQTLRGIGLRSSVTLTQELFGWRNFRNRRQVGGYLGLGGTPYDSGAQVHDQGIGKTGNRHARRVLIPLAWGWLRFQPGSELSRWFAAQFAQGGTAARRRGIVAVARRLAIALWRYVTHGTVPPGAVVRVG